MFGTMEMNVLEVGTLWRSLVLVCLLLYRCMSTICRQRQKMRRGCGMVAAWMVPRLPIDKAIALTTGSGRSLLHPSTQICNYNQTAHNQP